jgi:sigma-E factor negative regulatory protein RseB
MSQPLLADTAPAPFAAEGVRPIDILAIAGESARKQNFQGVVIYRDDRSLDALRVVHRFKDGHESERVTSLNGEPRDLLREDDHVYCILPKDRRMQVSRPAIKGFLSQLTPERLAELTPWYDFRAVGTARVAGRNCVGAAVMPRDGFRYGYELWADQETGVPLKFSLLGSDGHVIEQVMFTEVAFPGSIPDDSFKLQVNTAESRVEQRQLPPPTPLAALAGDAPQQAPLWSFEHLPPGFRVVMQKEENLPDGSGRMMHTLLTDGLTTISVFSDEVHGADKELHGLVQRGSFQAYGRVVGSFHVTIVGDAPASTVRLIGDSLQPSGSEAAAAALTPQAMPKTNDLPSAASSAALPATPMPLLPATTAPGPAIASP